MNVYSSTMHRKAKNWKQSNSSISGERRDRLWRVLSTRWNGMLPTHIYRPLWKDVTSRWGVMLYITYLGFFCMGDILLPSVGSFSCLCRYGLMDILPYTLSYNPELHYLFCGSDCVCILHCLIPGTTTHLSSAHPRITLESAVSPRSSGFFSRRMMLETQTWIVLVATGVS